MEATVADIMRKRFVSFKPSDPIGKAITEFTRNPDMAFPVIDEKGRVIGELRQHEVLKLAVPAKYVDEARILGPRGIKDALERSGSTVADFMEPHEIKVKPTTSVREAAQIMMDTEVLTLEVVECGKPIGFVSEIDILKFLKKSLK